MLMNEYSLTPHCGFATKQWLLRYKKQISDVDSTLKPEITRRDFMGATLLGAGAALLHSPCPATAQKLGPAWTGYGGAGDYRFSNGNTADVVRSAHRIRDGQFSKGLPAVIDTNEHYDAVIVGGGFAGTTAMYEFKKRKANGTCLLIDNHPIFGGFAKSNEFDVDGYRLAGAQASINFLLPESSASDADGYWQELGLPAEFDFAKLEAGDRSIGFPKATSAAVYWGEQCASIGYYFRNSLTNGTGRWVKNIWDDNLARAPWPASLKQELLAFRDLKTRRGIVKDELSWLDSLTYGDYITRELGLSAEVLSYIAPIMALQGLSPQVSAYAASAFPGVARFSGRSPLGDLANRFMSFPGGNATILRHFMKAIFPDAIEGPKTFEAIANNSVNLSALDRPESAFRMRLAATAVRINHEGDPGSAAQVSIVYEKGGQLYRVRAKGAVLAIGSWVAKHIVTDLPSEYSAACAQFLYAPILMVNVALRNWRFLDKLGFSAARWFDGFGFYGTLRQPMIIGTRPTPFHPDKPMVMTFYVPLLTPSLPLTAQGPAGRIKLFGTSYADYERQLVAQMQQMFAAGGFDARTEIAGIVLNRWGHAFVSPPPGFFFGKDHAPSPLKILRERFGRIAFGNAELAGLQSWPGAVTEGKRAITQILQAM
jgi:spermidine dehydrogenase